MKTSVCLPASLAFGWYISGEILLNLEAEIMDELGKGRLEEIFVISWDCSQGGKGDHNGCPTTELGMRVGESKWKNRRGEDMQSAYPLP